MLHRPGPSDDKGYFVRQSGEYKKRASGLYTREERPIVKAFGGPFSGQAQIPRSWALTINGTTVSPTCVYLASDINTSTGAWAEHFGTAAGAMALQAGSPTYDVASLLGVGGGDDEGVTGDGTAYWQVGGTSFGQPSTLDLVFEIVGVAGAAGSLRAILSTYDGGSGFNCGLTTTNQLALYLKGAGGAQYTYGATMPVGTLFHAMWFADYGASAIAYTNAIAGTAQSIAAVGDMTDASPSAMQLMGSPLTFLPFNGTLLATAMWQGDGFLDTHLQADLAAERFWRWCGIYPQLAPRGAYSISFSRSTTKLYHRTTGSATRPNEAHLAGSGLLCVDDDGVPIHAAQVNRIGYSIVGGTGWGTRGSCTATGSQTAPDGSATAYKIASVGASTVDDIYRAVAGFTNDAALGSGLWLKQDPAAPTGVVSISNPSSGSYGRWTVDLSALSSEWEYLTDAHPAVTILSAWVASPTGGAGFHLSRYSGPATLSFYTWECTQTESSGHVPVPGPPVPVHDGSATATCNADDLSLDSALATEWSRTREGTIDCKFIMPAQPDIGRRVWHLSDGTSTNRIDLYVNTTGKLELYASNASGAQCWIANAANVSDNAAHTCSVSWRDGRFSLLLDGVEYIDGARTNEVPPITQFEIGRFSSTGYEFGGHIYDMRGYTYARH